MDRMNPLDSMFLDVEDGTTHMHIGSCSVFEGPAPGYDEIVALIASKLPLIPRYRQVVRFVPGRLGRPVWVDDRHFNLDYHVRHSALPPAGSGTDLNTLMGRLMSQELDRHRPLWEAWMIEGLPDDQWAIISKVHHCMVDGVSGTDLITSLLDTTRQAPQPAPDNWMPAAEPSDVGAHRRLARPPGHQPGRAGPRPADARTRTRASSRHTCAARLRWDGDQPFNSRGLDRPCRSKVPSAHTAAGPPPELSSPTSRRSSRRSAGRSTTSCSP